MVAPTHPCVWVVRASLVMSLFSGSVYFKVRESFYGEGDAVVETFTKNVPAYLDTIPEPATEAIVDMTVKMSDEPISENNNFENTDIIIHHDEAVVEKHQVIDPHINDDDQRSDTINQDVSGAKVLTDKTEINELALVTPMIDDSCSNEFDATSSFTNENDMQMNIRNTAATGSVIDTPPSTNDKPLKKSDTAWRFDFRNLVKDFIETNIDPYSKWEEVKSDYSNAIKLMEKEGGDFGQWISNANRMHLDLLIISVICGLLTYGVYFIVWRCVARPILRFIYQITIGRFRASSSQTEENAFAGKTAEERHEILKILEERLARLDRMEAHTNYLIELTQTA